MPTTPTNPTRPLAMIAAEVNDCVPMAIACPLDDIDDPLAAAMVNENLRDLRRLAAEIIAHVDEILADHPAYDVITEETHAYRYTVAAASEDEAARIVASGDVDSDHRLEHIDTTITSVEPHRNTEDS